MLWYTGINKIVQVCSRCGGMENTGLCIEKGELFIIDFTTPFLCFACSVLPKTDRYGRGWTGGKDKSPDVSSED